MTVNPTFFVIMVELLALESLALVVITVLYVRRKYQYKHVVDNIIAAAESSEAARQKVLEQTLKDVFNEDDADANTKAQQLAKAESRFCKRLISAFVARKHGILSRIDKMTDELLSPYRSLISETAQEKVQTEKKMSKNIDSLKHTIDSLKEEKQRITQQLADTEQELNNIMSEYVSAFQKEELLKQDEENKDGDAAAPQPAAEAPPEAPQNDIAVTDAAASSTAAPATEGIEITDETPDEQAPAAATADDEGLLKLEDDAPAGVAVEAAADGEVAASDAAQDQPADEIEIADSDENMTENHAAAPAEEERAPENKAAAEEPEEEAADKAPDAILEDVDMSSAPLMDDLAADNSAKPRSAAAR